jgi:hypothetical protein
MRKALTVSDDIIKTATERIVQIDFKTVSIVFFEQTISGNYDDKDRYRIIYPDGSEK